MQQGGKMEQVLKELGIDKPGEYGRNNTYVVDIENSDEFGKIYSILDKNDDVEQNEENSLLTLHNASIYYLYGDYQINLIADFDADEYRMVLADVAEEMSKERDDEEDE